MLKWLKRKRPAAPDATLPDGWFRPASAESLLAKPERQQQLNLLWQHTSVPKDLFDQLYLTPVSRLAELVQQFPASENHHHSQPGGMLDHCLDVACHAAQLRQNHLLPASAPAEEQAKQTEVWTAAVIYAALLHDIGKIAVDIVVELTDGRIWHPWMGPVPLPWRLRYHSQNKDYHLHPAAGALLCAQILPQQVMNWLAGYREAFSALLYCVAGHYDKAGILGELVQKADRASVARDLGGDSVKAIHQPVTSLAGQIVSALRYLVQNEFTLNNTNSGSDGWLTEDALWLISKTTADRIRAYLLKMGVTGVPDSNIRLFDEMLAHRIALPNGDKAIWSCTVESDSGWSAGCELTLLKISPALVWEHYQQRPAAFAGSVEPSLINLSASTESPISVGINNSTPVHSVNPDEAYYDGTAEVVPEYPPNLGEDFFAWLKAGLSSGRLVVNERTALVHRVEDEIFIITPGIFKCYMKDTTGEAGEKWRQVQKAFQELRIHHRGRDGLNIWTCEVKGLRFTRAIKGFLLGDQFKQILDNKWGNNPWLVLKKE